MRPVIATILLLCLLAPMLFTSAWMQLHRWQIRKDLKSALMMETENPKLVWLKLTRQQAEKLRWENELEFERNGTRYDLVRTESVGDSLHLLCWPDHLETGLGKQLDQLLNQSADPQQQQKQASLQDFLKSLPNLSFTSQPAKASFTEGEKPAQPDIFPIRFATPPPSPPPEVVSIS